MHFSTTLLFLVCKRKCPFDFANRVFLITTSGLVDKFSIRSSQASPSVGLSTVSSIVHSPVILTFSTVNRAFSPSFYRDRRLSYPRFRIRLHRRLSRDFYRNGAHKLCFYALVRLYRNYSHSSAYGIKLPFSTRHGNLPLGLVRVPSPYFRRYSIPYTSRVRIQRLRF